MKCKCCNQEIKQASFIWHDVPSLGISLSETCDSCAQRLFKSFLEENSPEYSRHLSGREEEYEQLLKLLDSF